MCCMNSRIFAEILFYYHVKFYSSVKSIQRNTTSKLGHHRFISGEYSMRQKQSMIGKQLEILGFASSDHTKGSKYNELIRSTKL